MIAKQWKCVRLPAAVDFDTAAAVWHNYSTRIAPCSNGHEPNALKRCSSPELPVGWLGRRSGQIPSVPMNLPLLKNCSIVGVFTGAWQDKFPDQSARMNEVLAQLLSEGKISPACWSRAAAGADQGGDADNSRSQRVRKNRTQKSRSVVSAAVSEEML